jgi:triosephosphate isomerase
MTRKKLLAGNWKMHKTRGEATDFFRLFTSLLEDLGSVTKKVDIAFGVPATLFDACLQSASKTGVKILAQNVHFEKLGAFTGEISVGMLTDAGVSGSIIGHSERRQYYSETDEAVGKKWNALSLAGLEPIVCVGETRSERESGQTNKIVKDQLLNAIKVLSPEAKGCEFVIAYEPVWAIGTGLTATPEQAQEVHKMIRDLLAAEFGADRAKNIRILYGGSMNVANCADLLKQADIDGGLIGGASLKADDFAKMVKLAL